MIDIVDELSRLSMKLTTKYRIVNQKRSHFMREDDDEKKKEKIQENKIKTENNKN